MKIKLYSVGGINYIPTSGNAAGQSPAASSTGNSGSSENSKVPGFTKEIIDLVKENGLDNDVTQFLKGLERTLNLAADPTGEHLSMRDILRVTRDANRVRQNYESSKRAEDALKAQDSWGEVATDDKGNLWVINNEGQLDTISAKTYSENKNSYQVLTNSDLLNIRKDSRYSQLAFRTDILNNITSSVGSKTIVEEVDKLIKLIGTTEIIGYTNKQQEELIKGLQTLMSGGPDGTYKFTKESQIQDEDLGFVLDYIYRNLPNTYKNTLTAKAAVEGLEANPYGAKTLIALMVTAGTNRKLAVDFDKSATETSRNGSNGSDGGSLREYTLPETYATGEGAPTGSLYNITPQGSNAHMLVYGQQVGPIFKDDKGTPLEASTIQQVFNNGYGIRAVTNQTVVFGDQIIDPTDYGNIIYDQSDMRRVIMPAKVVNGEIVPDFELQETVQKLQKRIEEQEMDPAMINQYVAKVIPGAIWDAETSSIKLPSNKTHAFLTFGAITATKYLENLNKDSKYIEKMSSEDKQKWKDRYKMAIKYGFVDPGKNPQEVVGHGDKFWFQNADFYRANVFIPISDRLMGSTVYNPQMLPKSVYQNTTEREAQWERAQQLKEQNRQTNF